MEDRLGTRWMEVEEGRADEEPPGGILVPMETPWASCLRWRIHKPVMKLYRTRDTHKSV